MEESLQYWLQQSMCWLYVSNTYCKGIKIVYSLTPTQNVYLHTKF